jgi:hypothetical protein
MTNSPYHRILSTDSRLYFATEPEQTTYFSPYDAEAISLCLLFSFNFLCSLYNSGCGHVTTFMITFASRICSPGCTILDFHFMTTYDSFTPHKHHRVLLASSALCASGDLVPSTIQTSYDNLAEYGAHEPRPNAAVAVSTPCALHEQYHLPTSWKETAYMLNENDGAYHTRRTLMRNEMLCLFGAR